VNGGTAPRPSEDIKSRSYDRGTASQRGYGKEWRRLRAAAIAAQPWCTFCRHPGSKENPLSADHIVEKARGGTDDPSNIRDLCRRCNQQRLGAQANPAGQQAYRPSPQANRDDAPSHDDGGACGERVQPPSRPLLLRRITYEQREAAL
jgi:HNH endonuclease